MADLRFFHREGPFSIAQLAAIVGDIIILGDDSLLIEDVSTLNHAGAHQLSVLHNSLYLPQLAQTNAGACIVAPEFKDQVPPACVAMITDKPYRAFALIASYFYSTPKRESFVHPTAVVDPTASLGKNCYLEAGVVIGPKAVIGDDVVIGAHTVIDQGVVIGKGTVIESHVSLAYALIGEFVHIKPGARIGQEGFGFFMDQDGSAGGHVPVPQLGRVVIENYVEIGANVTIDRGSAQDTFIGAGTRIDNLVQIAHNVHIGRGCVLVAQVGVAGSTRIEDYVAIGGQAGLIGHLKIGRGARIAAQTGVMRSVEPGEVLAGSPAVPARTWHRQNILLKRMAEGKGKG